MITRGDEAERAEASASVGPTAPNLGRAAAGGQQLLPPSPQPAAAGGRIEANEPLPETGGQRALPMCASAFGADGRPHEPPSELRARSVSAVSDGSS